MNPYRLRDARRLARVSAACSRPLSEFELRRLASAVNMTFTAQPDDVANRRVYRDPCVKCGVRGDVSCKHREAA